jgi:hypothetical protein
MGYKAGYNGNGKKQAVCSWWFPIWFMLILKTMMRNYVFDYNDDCD